MTRLRGKCPAGCDAAPEQAPSDGNDPVTVTPVVTCGTRTDALCSYSRCSSRPGAPERALRRIRAAPRPTRDTAFAPSCDLPGRGGGGPTGEAGPAPPAEPADVRAIRQRSSR